VSALLPDCTRCGGRVARELGAEVCQGCGLDLKPPPVKVDRAEIRAQVAEVRRTRPLLCPSCLGRRCHGCRSVNCGCPGPRHPHRPAGDLTPGGMALLAGETVGHLEPAELTGSDR
jgi:hypothetical protein